MTELNHTAFPSGLVKIQRGQN